MYVGYAAGDHNLTGIWRVRPGSAPRRIIALPGRSFPNGMTLDAKKGWLYFNSSLPGVMLRAPAAGGAPAVWADGAKLKLNGLYGFGANGLKIHNGAVWVTNFDQGTLLRSPSGATAKPARCTPEPASPAGRTTSPGVNQRTDTVIAALDPGNQVIRIDHDGSYHTLLTAADGLQGPTSVAKVGNKLYVFTAAHITTHDPNILLSTHNH